MEKGNPPSLANAQVNLETLAVFAKADIKAITRIADSIAKAALTDPPVACWKIAIKGKPVGVVRASSKFWIQKRRVRRKPKARVPLMKMVRIMILGITVADLRVSSDMWIIPSKPGR